MVERIVMLVIWDAIAPIMTSLYGKRTHLHMWRVQEEQGWIMNIVHKIWASVNIKHYRANKANWDTHYNDVIMGTMASQITSLTIVYSGADQGNIKAPRHWPLCGEFTPAQMASNAENSSIWWRHHDYIIEYTATWGKQQFVSNLHSAAQATHISRNRMREPIGNPFYKNVEGL